MPSDPQPADASASLGTTDRSYPCEGCGARVEFAPGAGQLKCPYCGHEQAIAAVPRQVREHPIEELATLRPKPMATPNGKVYLCPGCHAVTESDTLSDRCQFCGTALVADATLTERIVPEAVLPFAVDQQAAREELRKWTSSRWFAPSSLKEVTAAETFRGSYLPHWTFDAQTSTDYTGERGDHYYTTETYTTTENGQTVTKERQVRHTRWTRVSGTVDRDFDDLLEPGTTQVPAKTLDVLTPWPLTEAVAYQEEYLAGFRTVRYDIEPEDALETAKLNQIVPVVESDCRSDIGGDEQRLHRTDTAYWDVTYKLVLLPVWFLTYLHAGKSWQVVVNARTGEVTGKRPYSAAKIAAFVVAVLAAIAVVTAVVLAVKH